MKPLDKTFPNQPPRDIRIEEYDGENMVNSLEWRREARQKYIFQCFTSLKVEMDGEKIHCRPNILN